MFDPLTGEVLRKLPRYTIFPKTHYVTPREALAVLDDIRKGDRLEWLREHDKLLEAQRLEQRTRFDLEMIAELGYCQHRELFTLSLGA